MTWAKIDDSMYDHPKILALGRDMDAMALWALGASYCARHLTNGRVNREAIRVLLPSTPPQTRSRYARALVRVNLWIECDDGAYQYRDWADYNPTADKIKTLRQSAAQRQREYRDRHAVTNAVSHAVRNGVRNASPVPSRPITTTPLPPASGGTEFAHATGENGSSTATPAAAPVSPPGPTEETDTDRAARREFMAMLNSGRLADGLRLPPPTAKPPRTLPSAATLHAQVAKLRASEGKPAS